MITNMTVYMQHKDLVFCILSLLKDSNDLVMAQMIADSLDHAQAQALVKYKLTGINPYDELLPTGLKCWIKPEDLGYISHRIHKEDYYTHELIKDGYIPVVVVSDTDFANGTVKIQLPALEGEIIEMYASRSLLLIVEKIDLSHNQTDESKEELGSI